VIDPPDLAAPGRLDQRLRASAALAALVAGVAAVSTVVDLAVPGGFDSRTLLTGVGAALTGVGVGLALARRRLRLLGSEVAISRLAARSDPGTGLSNRVGIGEELDRRLARRRRSDLVGVLVLDLDRLKAVNEIVGHRAGDEVLATVADRIRAAVRGDDEVGRLGSDEFCVVTSALRSVADLGRLAERILSCLAEPVVLSDGCRLVVTASIGISYVLRGDATAEDLVRDAEGAVHQAKDRGGSTHVVFDAELRAGAQARLELERELRRAVDDGELVVQYQPVVSIGTGQVELVEALVRWRHPTRGLIPPGQFLSVASQSGLIVELGRQVLATACEQAVRWSAEAGRPITVAVNLAERQLIDPSLAAVVAGALRSTGLPPGQLVLEVPEELLIDRPQRVLAVLRRLRLLGVGVALDDFGLARASLTQLKALDVIGTLKLDRTLVADVAHDAVDRQIVAAVVALAGSLGIDVVAEGVETPEQVAVLGELGVGRMQGFGLQRPDEAAAVGPVVIDGLAVGSGDSGR
jgi:diguanylate cyclase